MKRLLLASSLVCCSLAPSASSDSSREAPRAEHAAHELPLEEVARVATSPAASACAGCHAEIAREWAESMHHRAASDEVYVAAVAREPLAFCRKCHAPHGDPTYATARQPEAFEAGVSCTTCHEGMTAEHDARTRRPAKACASCHEFRFPDRSALMQRTASEHRESAHADASCASCHMPNKSHRFDIAPLLRSAIVADVARAGPTRVAFRLAPGEVGHAVPTGDLFRRLSVRVETGEHVTERYLSRHFQLRNGVNVERTDDRVGSRDLPRCFELDVPASADAPLVASIALDRVALHAGDDRTAVVAARLPLFSATLGSSSYRPCP